MKTGRNVGGSGWRQVALADLVLLQRGFDITKAEQEDGDIPVISSAGISSFHSEWKVSGPGVVIGRKGSLGTVHYSEGPYWPHDTTLWSKDLKGNHPKFVYYFLHTLSLNRYDVGNSNPTLNRNHIHGIKIRIPVYWIQERIASILSAYDDLIENNRRRIQLLEQSAQMLYKEWFVRLRFPGHEQVKVVDGVPEGWEKKTLNELTSVITKGTTPTTLGGVFVDDGINFLKVESIDSSGNIVKEKLAKIEEGTYELLNRSKLLEGDILFSIAGAIGRASIVPSWVLPANTNQALAIIRPKDPMTKYYLYWVVRSDMFLSFSMGRVVQTAQANVSLTALKSAKMLVPSDMITKAFVKKVVPIHQQIDCLNIQINTANQARDLLLPRLMNGEIAV